MDESQAPNVKQVIVMRHDLKMHRGKQIAQGTHASMAFLTRRLQSKRFAWMIFYPTNKPGFWDHLRQHCEILQYE
jgi:peptidyl-tRNA hydrolase